MLPLLLLPLAGGSGTAAICRHHRSARALLSACRTDWFDDSTTSSYSVSTIRDLYKLHPILPGPEPTPSGPDT
eukprot:2410847-Rhodomonas_salina.1